MQLTLLKTTLRDHMRRPWLTLLMILSVALGVAVVVSVDLANASATRAFKLSTDAVVGKATHQIVSSTNSFDDSVYTNLRVKQGNRLTAPVVEGYANAIQLGNQTMHVLGVDIFAEPPFRTYLTANTQVPIEAFAAFLTQPGTILISADTASRFNLKTGDKISLVIGAQEKPVTIVGLMSPPNDISSRALEGLILTDISTAQELFAMQGKLSRIDLIATTEQANAIAATLPGSLRLVPASEQANTVTQLTAAFQLNLTAFSLLALAVGMFLIYNTTLFSVVQRRRTLGILRCVGVTGQQIFAMILIEAAISGAIGAVIGIGLGIVLGRITVALVTQTINDLYFSVTVRGVDIDWQSMVKGMVLGAGAAVIAAALPAAEAANVPAVTVLSRSDLEMRIRKLLPAITGIGIAMVFIGAALLLVVQSNVTFSFVGIFVALFGATFGVPVLTILFMRLSNAVFGRWVLLGRMAARTVTQALSRTSVAIAALMVAVSVTIGVTVMIESFRSTVVNWLDQTLIADIYVSLPLQGASNFGSMDASLVDKVKNIPGISAIELVRNANVYSPQFGDIRLIAPNGLHNRVMKASQFSGDEIMRQVQNGAMLISEPFANKYHVQIGDSITLTTNVGPEKFPVVGIFYDYSSDQGLVLLWRDVYRQYWDDNSISAIAAYVDNRANQNQIEDRMRLALGGACATTTQTDCTPIIVQSNKSLRDSALVIFDRTFAITAALRVIAVVVAFIGVLGALMALQLERTRELGTLRATGMTLQQLWRLTLLESGLMGATAGILSIPIGVMLSAILIYVINLRSFGWTIFFEPVPETYVQAFFISIAAALLAAVYPMLRLSRLQVADALREE